MPLVRIDLPTSTPSEQIDAVSRAVHQALVDTFNVPLADKFQTVTKRDADALVCTPEFLSIQHTKKIVFVQIHCSPGRSLEMKQALYKQIARQISDSTELLASDVIINLVETARENWSFGNGIAQYTL